MNYALIVPDGKGDSAFGTDDPTAKVHINQGDLSGAKPVLKLNQSDVSEEFIDFIAVEAVGNPVEDVGAKALTTTKFIKMSVNGSQLYIPVGTIA